MQAPWRHCWLYRFAILTALFLSLTYHSPGQTIEAVLRALNLRVAYSGGTPLQWSDNVPAFPADGTITSLSDAIDALNMASQTYEQVQWSFYACDPNTLHLVNLVLAAVIIRTILGRPLRFSCRRLVSSRSITGALNCVCSPLELIN
jgi:hypothetical protein